MILYLQAYDLLSSAFLAQTVRRNTVSIGTEPEEGLFCDFVMAAFDQD